MAELDALKAALQRERVARKEAERIIEEKSRELYTANEELRKLNESLEDKVRERTAELEATNKDLRLAKEHAEASTRAKSEFLSNMSHEIRTPLNAVLGFTELLELENLPDQARPMLQNIRLSADTLMSLINDILDLSAIESGKVDLERTTFDLTYLCRRIKETVKLKAQEKNIRLQLSLDDELPQFVIGDPTRLNQILLNLMSNAVKFTESGKVRLDVFVAKKNNTLHSIRFEITDTGIGIPADRLDAIFDKFVQAEQSTRRKYGGSGLGLAITKQLIELQGGQLEVKSTVGEGSVFSFTIGYEVDVQQGQVDTDVEIHPLPDDLRVLLVEDTLLNQYLIKGVLEKVGVAPVIANNGQEALEYLKENSFDVVLLDLHMPVMDGSETARRIRDGETLQPDIPLIGLTADVFTETRESMLEAGVNDFLTKPVKMRQLIEKLRLVAENR